MKLWLVYFPQWRLRLLGESVIVAGVTKVEAPLATIVPIALVAVTVKPYTTQLVKPVTVIKPLPD
jgi:hypothetical protein